MTNQFDHLRTPQLKEPKAKRGKEPSDFERQWLVTLYSQGQFT